MPLARAQVKPVHAPGPAPLEATLIDGLTQRARLLELILTDLLGPRTTLRDGLLPPEFAVDVDMGADWRRLHVYAAELVRCPDGIWRVAGDLAAGVVNHPASRCLEAPALVSFLPGLSRFLLNEPLRLASSPSRWLGDPGALRDIYRDLHRWAIVDAFRVGPAWRLEAMTLSQRMALQERVGSAPRQFTARLLVDGEAARVALVRGGPTGWATVGCNFSD